MSEEDYARAQQVWTKFNISKMKEYHDLCLSWDVRSLADVVENFRKMGTEYYGSDALRYYTLPGFTLDACLKKTKQSLKLLMSSEHLLFFENSITGGISVVSHRQAKANNPIVPNYTPDDVTSWPLYGDANNLYAHAMSSFLATSIFRFITEDELASFDLSKTTHTDGTGYALEVDLDYPRELHDLHSDYIHVTEKLKITRDKLSPYSLVNDLWLKKN